MTSAGDRVSASRRTSTKAAAGGRTGNDVIMVPVRSTGMRRSASARAWLRTEPQFPVSVRCQIAELAAAGVALGKQADATGRQVEHAAPMVSGDRIVDARVVQAQSLGNRARLQMASA